MLAILPIKAKLWMMTVPLLGQHLLITKLVRGEMIAGLDVAICVSCGFVVAGIVSALTARIYQSERLAISG